MKRPSDDFAGRSSRSGRTPGSRGAPSTRRTLRRQLEPDVAADDSDPRRADNATLSFDEIALVEPGDPGSVFGDPAFWDYVVVEGSRDGVTWLPVRRASTAAPTRRVPVVVLRSPTDFRGTGLETLSEEILVLGRLFGKEREAAALAAELADVERLVRTRVSAVSDREKVRALYLGLASGARASGGAAFVWGRDTVESWMLEHVVGARNAYTGPGSRVLLNAEQILALDPDVIFLPTANGYHPPRELTEAPYSRNCNTSVPSVSIASTPFRGRR